METNCPKQKELESYALSLLDQGIVEESVTSHIKGCLRCQTFVKKWKDYIKSDLFALTPKLKGYKTLELIGVGNYSKVYLVQHELLQKKCAIKIINPIEDNEEFQNQFIQMAQFLSKIQHPNIISLIDAMIDSHGLRYLIFEYLKGKTLEELVPVPLEKAYHYMEQMTLGIQELHQNQFLLGDITPRTFHVNAQDQLKILDFGFIKEKSQYGNEMTNVTSNIFIPYYKSPEQCIGQTLNSSSDIYSLGATFYTIIHGSPAFSGLNFPETIKRILNLPPPDLTIKHPEIPRMLNRLIQQMMHKLPTERISLKEVLDVIRTLKKGETLEFNEFLKEDKNQNQSKGINLATAQKTLGKEVFVSKEEPLEKLLETERFSIKSILETPSKSQAKPKIKSEKELQNSRKPVFPKQNILAPQKTKIQTKNIPSMFKEPHFFEEMCPRCFERKKEFFKCLDCGEQICLAHLEKNDLCNFCYNHQQTIFLSNEVEQIFEFFKKYSQKEFSIKINSTLTGKGYRELFNSIFENPFGGFVIFTNSWKRLGLMIQPKEIRLFLYGYSFIRNLTQLMLDLGKIQEIQITSAGYDLEQEIPEKTLQKLSRMDNESFHKNLKSKLIYQEVVGMLALPATHIKYIAGRVPQNKLDSMKPDLQIIHDEGFCKQWLNSFGNCLYALEQTGTILLTTRNHKKLGIQLDDQHLRVLYFQETEKNRESSVILEDCISTSQLEELDIKEQEFRHPNEKNSFANETPEHYSEVQFVREKIYQELKLFLEQPSLEITFLESGIQGVEYNKIYINELVADYRSLIIRLLGKLNKIPQRFNATNLLKLICNTNSPYDAAASICKEIQHQNKFLFYQKEMGNFEASLILLLNIKQSLLTVIECFENIEKILKLMERKKDQSGILETGLLLFPNNQKLQEKLSTLYHK